MLHQQSSKQANPVSYAFSFLNTDLTRYQYTLHLSKLFQFLQLLGSTLEEQGQAFLDKARADPDWAQEGIMQFLSHHKDRAVNKKEITPSTLTTYRAPIKLFCEMNDLDSNIKWKRIVKALPKPKNAANDRAPTVEEIQKLAKYSDRRIRAIVFTMWSSGIRLGLGSF